MKFRKYKLYAVDLIANIAEYTQTGADSRLNFLGKDNGFIYFG